MPKNVEYTASFILSTVYTSMIESLVLQVKNIQYIIGANMPLDLFQYGFGPGFDIDITLVALENTEQPSPLILLDLLVAFDTVNHPILIHHLEHEAGIKGL